MFERTRQFFANFGTPPAPAPAVAAPRAFDIGRSGRRLAAIPSNATAINSLIRTYGPRAVARSRYLAKNNAYAASAKEVFTSALVGPGIKPSTLGETKEAKKALQELWLDWIFESDFDGILDHYGQQSLGASELFEAGEFFAVVEDAPEMADEGLPPFKVRLLQSEMLPYYALPARGVSASHTVEMGIEFNGAGKRVAYHFLKALPGDKEQNLDAGTVRIPADRVLHVYRPVVIGQIRGIPHTLSGMVTLAMLDLYDDAELERKRVAALFGAFVTRETSEDDDSPLGALVAKPNEHTDQDAISMEPGAVINLLEGESVEFAEPADLGGSYEAFQYRALLKAAAGFGVPYAAFTGDLKSANYSSIRAGLVEFRRRIDAMQHNVMVHQFCRPVWNRFLDLAVMSGLAPWTAAEYQANKRLHRRTKFLPPKWDWVDPKKDIEAEILAVDNGFKARSDVIESTGYDPEETDARIHDDRLRAEELAEDLDGPLFGKETPAPAALPAPGEGDDEDPDGPPRPSETTE
jgi:lambda family phage portal protein